MPSRIMLEAVHFIHKAGYSHVIIQQVPTPLLHPTYCLASAAASDSDAGLLLLK